MSFIETAAQRERQEAARKVTARVIAPLAGSDEQRSRWLPRLFSGDWLTTAAITEPQAGSDMRNFKTTAVLDGDAYVVNGAKRWIKPGGVADLVTKLQAARLLCLNTLAILDSGQRAPRDVSMAKVYAVETSIAVCQLAMESMGAWGLSVEAGVERCWRDCMMLTAIDGTATMQRLIIGREMLGVPAFV